MTSTSLDVVLDNLTAVRNQTVRRRLAYLDAEIRARYFACPAPDSVLDDYEALLDLLEDAVKRGTWPGPTPHVTKRSRVGSAAEVST